MSVLLGASRRRSPAAQASALAAATVVAGAGLFGAPVIDQQFASAPLSHAQRAVTPTAFPTFAESLQNLLNTMRIGDLNQVLATFGDAPGTTTPFSVDSDVSALLASLNPGHTSLNNVTDLFGISLTEPLYSSAAGVDSVLGAGSLLKVGGVPIGDADLNQLIDFILGPGASTHSLTDLAGLLGMGSLLNQYGSLIGALGLKDLNIVNCGLLGLICSSPALTSSSSLQDWLSGILQTPTTDVTKTLLGGTPTVQPDTATTLGEYLHTLSFGSTPMDQATLGQLFGLTPGEPWDQYLSSLPIGGNVFDHTGTFGAQTIGAFLGSLLPEGSALSVTGDTTVTGFLEALGLLSP